MNDPARNVKGSGNPAATDSLTGRVSSYRDELLKWTVIALTTLLINAVMQGLASRILTQPWRAIWILASLVSLVWFLWQGIRKNTGFRLDRRLQMFLAAYTLLFSLAVGTSVLDLNRDLLMLGGLKSPRNWLTPNWAGDWRYWLVDRQAQRFPELIVVTLEEPRGKSLEEARFELENVINLVVQSGAVGIGLDYYFEDESKIDWLLCQTVQNVRILVVAGYSFRPTAVGLRRTQTPRTLQTCLPDASLGHLAGYVELDGAVRYLPSHFQENPNLPAFSLRVAMAVTNGGNPGVKLDPQPMLRFVEPKGGFQVLSHRQLLKDPDTRWILQDRLVLVGEESKRERFSTPFGERPEVLIHASAIHSIRSQQLLRHTSWWLSFLFILSSCYALVGILLLSALCVRLGQDWVDIVYL